jgi:hypothetical protein
VYGTREPNVPKILLSKQRSTSPKWKDGNAATAVMLLLSIIEDAGI